MSQTAAFSGNVKRSLLSEHIDPLLLTAILSFVGVIAIFVTGHKIIQYLQAIRALKKMIKGASKTRYKGASVALVDQDCLSCPCLFGANYIIIPKESWAIFLNLLDIS